MSRSIEERTVGGKRAPLYIEGKRNFRLADFVAENRLALASKLIEHAAIIFRGFEVNSPAQFSEFVSATGLPAMDYRHGSTPRKQVAAGIYTSTEYPANREIPLHQENAYTNRWPRSVAFCCIVPALRGGETPIADMREVVKSIGPGLMDRLESAGVQYVRHFHDGFDLSWRDTFQTSDPAELARLCNANGIRYEWLDERARLLRTVQTCQGVAYHSQTAERLFFNQAHLFHATSLGAEVLGALRDAFGADRLPRHSRYGDGSEIPGDDLLRIRSAFGGNAMTFPWQPGDVMWLDNLQIAHGRAPFHGERRILSALLDPEEFPRTAAAARSL